MLDKFKFSEIIEGLKLTQGLPYIEVINDYCDEHDIDIEIVPELLTDNLKYNLTKESIALRLVDAAALDDDDDAFGLGDEDVLMVG